MRVPDVVSSVAERATTTPALRATPSPAKGDPDRAARGKFPFAGKGVASARSATDGVVAERAEACDEVTARATTLGTVAERAVVSAVVRGVGACVCNPVARDADAAMAACTQSTQKTAKKANTFLILGRIVANFTAGGQIHN